MDDDVGFFPEHLLMMYLYVYVVMYWTVVPLVYCCDLKYLCIYVIGFFLWYAGIPLCAVDLLTCWHAGCRKHVGA